MSKLQRRSSRARLDLMKTSDPEPIPGIFLT
jgi:hypothetical protein